MATSSRCRTNGIKEDRFLLELSNRFETVEELDDIGTMSETTVDTIQHSASKVAKAINKPLKSRISSPTRREMVGNGDDKQRLSTQKYARPSKRKQERTSENANKRSYEERS